METLFSKSVGKQMKWSKNGYKQAKNIQKILPWQLVRTERRAHVEIILSKTGKNLLQNPDSFCKSALFLPFSIWHFWPDHISAHRQKNRPTWELCPWWAVNWLLSLDAQLLKIAVIP